MWCSISRDLEDLLCDREVLDGRRAAASGTGRAHLESEASGVEVLVRLRRLAWPEPRLRVPARHQRALVTGGALGLKREPGRARAGVDLLLQRRDSRGWDLGERGGHACVRGDREAARHRRSRASTAPADELAV